MVAVASTASFARMADDTRLWYHDSGGTGTPIVLHHGHTADRANWGFPVPGLNQRSGVAVRLERMGYRVIVMECRGAGESDDGPEGTRNIPQFAEDVVALLDHLGLARAVFGGHSMGGGVGFELASRHGTRLQALVLLAPIPARGFAGDAAAREKVRALPVGSLGTYFFHKGLRPEEERMAFRRASAWHPSETEDWARHRTAAERRCGHTLEGWRSMYVLDLEGALASLRLPVLVLAGAADALLPANVADFERMPTATLHVVAHAGHELAVHAPEDVARAIDVFLAHGAHNYKQITLREQLASPPAQTEEMKRARDALRGLLRGRSKL